MQPEGWDKRIGKSGWSFLTVEHDASDVASIMTKLYELGWRGPEIAPVINPEGTAVLWNTAEQRIPVLTSEGLLAFYNEKGHRWFVLRVEQLLRGCSGPLAARLQEVFAQYEEQCSCMLKHKPQSQRYRAFGAGGPPNWWRRAQCRRRRRRRRC